MTKKEFLLFLLFPEHIRTIQTRGRTALKNSKTYPESRIRRDGRNDIRLHMQ